VRPAAAFARQVTTRSTAELAAGCRCWSFSVEWSPVTR
jgi:hypothetical protein